MALGFALLLAPPALAWVAQLFLSRRILTEDAVAGYFFGVVAALLAVTIVS